MSSDYSSFERDYFRKQKRREDSKSSKISPKEMKVYEPKSAQKSIKTQGYADESEQSSCYERSYYNNYTKSANKKNDNPYTSQAHSSSNKKHRGNNKFKVLKRDEERNKDNEDCHKDKSFKRDIIWVPASKSKVPSLLEEKQSIPNNSNPVALSSEPEGPLGQDSLITSVGYSKTVSREDRKPTELFNFSQDWPDPIQILKANLEKVRQRKADGVAESNENITGNKEEKSNEEREIEENDGTNYSDIDNMVEEKLLSNQIEPNHDTAFNQVELESRESLEDLDDNKRPVWENVDTHQVLKELKNSESFDMFSQRITAPNQSNKEEVTQNTSNNDFSQEEQLKEDDKEDYFDKVFSSFVIREEPMAVMPGIFNFGMKFSSDKQPQDTCLNRTNSGGCSRSFDEELIDRGKNNHKPLPAFRNHRTQKEPNSETPTKEFKNQPLINDSLKNYGNPGSTYSSQSVVFCKMIPNNQAKVWHYRDLEGVLQGPFSSQLMDSWYNKGYLHLDLDVTIANSRGFRKIRELVEIASNSQVSGRLPSASNRNNATKLKQNDNDLDETQNEINNSIENIISENCCPNIQYNFPPNNFVQNAIPKTLKTSLPNKPHQVPHSNQFQRYDYNRNYLRNLPR